MMPDDSQKCVNSLQTSLLSRNIHIPQPNATCDTIVCFYGIRLHQITSLSCPAVFNFFAPLKDDGKNGIAAGESRSNDNDGDERARKMFSRDYQLMGLWWLLARNKMAYIPTVSAVLRAMMYSAHPPHQSKCAPFAEGVS
ncbi:uncharacterized GPI-anchored protein At4g28100-like [Telopea speciosissima]|uniref:uncharacterized GPI-anchored protein At4g28100-like n=1 Tax=Telopea speciosissima TaxID=54955 RepID=UPI001CC81E4C|nr:uncharacterized GPI-anchored protein At4g28100-like [Telopea speciosissima]